MTETTKKEEINVPNEDQNLIQNATISSDVLTPIKFRSEIPKNPPPPPSKKRKLNFEDEQVKQPEEYESGDLIQIETFAYTPYESTPASEEHANDFFGRDVLGRSGDLDIPGSP